MSKFFQKLRTQTFAAGASITAAPTISANVAAVIVVGAILSVSLTSIAALMIFHVRSRLLKAAMAIYNHEKAESQYGTATTSPPSSVQVKEANVGAPPPGLLLQVPTEELMVGTLPRKCIYVICATVFLCVHLL